MNIIKTFPFSLFHTRGVQSEAEIEKSRLIRLKLCMLPGQTGNSNTHPPPSLSECPVPLPLLPHWTLTFFWKMIWGTQMLHLTGQWRAERGRIGVHSRCPRLFKNARAPVSSSAAQLTCERRNEAPLDSTAASLTPDRLRRPLLSLHFS